MKDQVPWEALLVISRFEEGVPGSKVGIIHYESDGSLRWEGDKKVAMEVFDQSMDINPAGPKALALDLLSALIDYADGKCEPYGEREERRIG